MRTVVLAAALLSQVLWSQPQQPLTIRGHAQRLYTYGSPSGDPVIVASGDGGWVHLAPQVAEFLAGRGYFVVGLDTRGYLESFTSGKSTLKPEDVPGDFRTLAAFAANTSTARGPEPGAQRPKPIFIGVSEGAGLAALAAGDAQAKSVFAGVIALGLPEQCELAWRWKDAAIYLTHRVPDEPTFNSADVVGRVAPIPLAAIHSSHDEFVPVDAIQRIMARANEPKRLWIIEASNHRFSDVTPTFNARLLEAIAWVHSQSKP